MKKDGIKKKSERVYFIIINVTKIYRLNASFFLMSQINKSDQKEMFGPLKVADE